MRRKRTTALLVTDTRKTFTLELTARANNMRSSQMATQTATPMNAQTTTGTTAQTFAPASHTPQTFAPASHTPQRIAYRRLLWVAPVTIVIATIANLGFYTAAGSLYPEVTTWQGASMPQIIGATTVYLLMGTLVFAVVARMSQRPVRNYLIVATVGLLLSMFMPISIGMGYAPPEIAVPSTATVITLCLMHVLSYVISVPMFVRLTLGE
jgi:hypothetical protein